MATIVSNSRTLSNWDAVEKTAVLPGQNVVLATSNLIIIGNHTGNPPTWTQNRIELAGENLTYNASNGAFGGTITGISVLRPDASDPLPQPLVISGISIDASQYGPLIKSGSYYALDNILNLYSWDIYGSAFHEDFTGGISSDVIRGGAGDDRLLASRRGETDTAQDMLVGGIGNDSYYVNSANDIIDERGSNDLLTTITAAMSIDLRVQFLGTSRFINLILDGSTAYGTEVGDTFYATAIDNTIYGFGGDDFLIGEAGSDMLFGGAGNDTLDASSPGYGMDGVPDHLYGRSGDDNYYIYEVADIVDESSSGSNGSDTIVTPYSFDLNTTTQVLGSIENLVADDTAVNLTGNALDNRLSGNHRDNILIGNAGGDHLSSRDGNDLVDGGTGDDLLFGGNGMDTAGYLSAGAGIVIDLQIGWQETGSAGKDAIFEIENVIGSNFFDTITGSSGINVLHGQRGADNLYGLAGNDQLFGGRGHDFLFGGAGDDFLNGGLGNDQLTGGALGADTFAFEAGWGADTIVDFRVGGFADVLQFEVAVRTMQSGANVVVTDLANLYSVTVLNADKANVDRSIQIIANVDDGSSLHTGYVEMFPT